MPDMAAPAAVVTCVACEQVLSRGRCTNRLCDGYVPLTEVETEHLLAHIDALEAALRPLLAALRCIADVRWQQALDGQLPDGFVLTTVYEVSTTANGGTMNSRSFTVADLRRAAELVGGK